MRADGGHGDGSRQPGLGQHLRPQLPAGSPGRRSGAKQREAMPSVSATGRDQSPVRGSNSSVVEALVSSAPTSPVSQYADEVGDQQQPCGPRRRARGRAATSW